MTGTIDSADIARFGAIAAEWWDPQGPFRPLHAMNPVRLAFIRDTLCAHYGRDATALKPFAGLEIADIGCGGGLTTEPLARLGATVTGIDAGAEGIAAARAHAAAGGLEIDYRQTTAEALAAGDLRFDAVIALEIVEHVADLDLFLAACCRLAKPGAALVFSTLNRTPRAYASAILGAERLLRWLPRGTHDWRKFVKPEELARGLAAHGAETIETRGMVFDPLGAGWRLGEDTGINYLLAARAA
jgi:2-polyprenyl-6-hydroxyphenyl methylase/3-demethylubiquinone-9 3-methyltransferase